MTPQSSLPSLEEVMNRLRRSLPVLSKKYDIKSLKVFGSYVRGEAKPNSDLDILVEFSKSPDIFKFMDLEEELSTVTGLRVELVSAQALRGNIGKRILAEVVPV